MDIETLLRDLELSTKNLNSSIEIDELFKDFKSTPVVLQQEIELSEDENSTNYSINENQLNAERLEFLENKITPLFLSIIKSEDFEFGQRSESINLVEEQLKINQVATQNWFNKLYLKYFASNDTILLSLLRIVEYVDKDLLYPTGQTMALASLSHRNDEVKEMGVRILESWCCAESYEILKNLKVESTWLQEYINQVLIDIKEELCLC